MSRGVDSILVTRQETIVLSKTKPTMTQGVPAVVRVRYNEPILNQ
jgi:hypothetical protein